MDEGTASGYLWAWGAYLVGAVGLLIVGWRITRPLSREWRHLLLVSAAALLLTPALMPGLEGTFLAPALFVLVLDGLFEGAGGATQAGLLLLGAWLLGLLVSLGFQFYGSGSAREKKNRNSASE